MRPLDLTGFVPLPHNPAYLVHADGRVASLKTSPVRVLSEHRTFHSVGWRVRIGRHEVRVRDLVYILHGYTGSFEMRAEIEGPARDGIVDAEIVDD